MTKQYLVLSFTVFMVFSLFFACGLVGSNSYSGGGGDSNISFQNSGSADKNDGTFTPPVRVSTPNTCADNAQCVQLCDSMLEDLSPLQDCYNSTEQEVQSLRDTYNLLAMGRVSKLTQVTQAQLEAFLKFGPVLYKTAIYGFEKGRKENCDPNDGSVDSREREDCKYSNYYLQEGYSSAGAQFALQMVAKNNWIAKLLLEYDEDHIIMLALLDIVARGGQYPKEPKTKDVCSGHNSQQAVFEECVESDKGYCEVACSVNLKSGACDTDSESVELGGELEESEGWTCDKIIPLS